MSEKEIRYRPSVELYNKVRHCDFGTFFSYANLREILGEDPQEKGRSAILTVRNWLLSRDDKLFLCKTGQGYYIAHPNQHVDYSRSEEEAGGKKIRRALKASVHVDMSQLTEEEKNALIEQQLRTGLKVSAISHVDRQKRITVDIEISLPTGQDLIAICSKKPINEN